jgi:hypothetical protein
MSVKLLLHSIFENSNVKVHSKSMNDVCKVIVWSLQSLFEGKHPSHDHNGNVFSDHSADAVLQGTPLTSHCSDFFGVLWSVKGDIKWYSEGLHLANHASNEPCDYCGVSKVGSSEWWPTNFASRAPWKQSLRSAQDWRARQTNMHLLFSSFPFLSILNVEPDELHVLYLGICQYFLGSMLWLLSHGFDERPAEKIKAVWTSVLEEYRRLSTPVQYSSLSLSSFLDMDQQTKSFPKLKGKGAEVKHLLVPLARVWRRSAATSDFYALVSDASSSLARAQEVLDLHKYDLFLSQDSVHIFQTSIDDFLRGYTRLGLLADSKGFLLFSAVPKLHWAWHLAQRASFLNPRRAACFIDEDFVKHIKKLASASASGTALHRIPGKLMAKYRHALSLEGCKVP